MTTRVCTGCANPISHKSRSGLCRSCNARAQSGPETRVKAAATWRSKLADPSYRARHFAKTKAGLRRKLAEDAEFKERRRETCRRLGLTGASIQAHPAGSAARKLSGRKVTEARLGWCPPKYRAEYQALARRRGFNAASARAEIERRMAAEMTPFERMMERVRKGAGIVEAPPLRRAESAYTLGGVVGVLV